MLFSVVGGKQGVGWVYCVYFFNIFYISFGVARGERVLFGEREDPPDDDLPCS